MRCDCIATCLSYRSPQDNGDHEFKQFISVPETDVLNKQNTMAQPFVAFEQHN
jgi:hypothetical protein